jgi:hypothetical protein
MVLTTPKQIQIADLPVPRYFKGQALCQQATVSVSGYFYVVDLGPNVHPQHHYVGKDRRCTCGLGADCPAVLVVADYLRAGGERAPDVPSGYYPVAPQTCPICGAQAYYVPGLTSRGRGAGWVCVQGGKAHYWQVHINSWRQDLAENPWIYLPVLAPDGTVLYPGLKRDEIITESQPWPDGYNPDR